MASTRADGKKNTWYPLASVMMPMKPLTQGILGSRTKEGREACDRTFALAYRYSRGQDLVEEMVVANCWPLGRNRPSMTIEMVNLPMFGEGVGFPSHGSGLRKRRAGL